MEACRAQNRRIKSALGKNRGTGVTRADLVDPRTAEITSLRKKQDIEQANIKHLPELFLCANDTPLRQPNMIAEFGYTGDTTTGVEVTEGVYIPPPTTDEYTIIVVVHEYT